MDLRRNLIFCNDGILRIEFHKNKKPIFYPLMELQKILDDDPTFILNVFNNNVSIESGTTLGNIILALEPWANIFHKFIDRDIQSYCDIYKTNSNQKQAFDYIEITKFIDISREYSYDPIRKDESFMEYLKRPLNKRPCDFFKLTDQMSVCGFKNNDSTNYSITTDFETICNTPVFLVSKQENIFFNDDNKNILNLDVSDIKKNDKATKFYSEAYYSLIDLVTAIFVYGLFYYTPITKEKQEALIKSLDDAVKSLEEKEENIPEDKQETSHTNIEVKIAPGAFDAIYEQEEQKINDNNTIFKKLASSPYLKIGELLIAQKDTSTFDDKSV